MANPPSSPPEWKAMLNKSISENMKKDKDSISYPLTTIGPDGGPKVRFVLHRGFVNERRKDGDGSSNLSHGNDNEDISSEILLSTTDIRAPKAQQLQGSDKIEIAWWFAPSGDQYRITGRAFIYGSPSHNLSKSFIQNHAMRLSPPSLVGKFDWEEERKRIFEKCSPSIKASFYRPAPGTPLRNRDRDDNGQDINMHDYPTELEDDDLNKDGVRQRCMDNFALTIIEPLAIDWVQLTASPNTRALWKKQDSGEWKKIELAP